MGGWMTGSVSRFAYQLGVVCFGLGWATRSLKVLVLLFFYYPLFLCFNFQYFSFIVIDFHSFEAPFPLQVYVQLRSSWGPGWGPGWSLNWAPVFMVNSLSTCTRNKQKSETCLTKNGKRAWNFISFWTLSDKLQRCTKPPNLSIHLPTNCMKRTQRSHWSCKGLDSFAERPRQGSCLRERYWTALSCVQLLSAYWTEFNII